ncbi:hypothetical protein FFF93_009950 [Arthrobacter sp. KBS0702]|uniref:hypothetical protein n=1 Tax=Arthrobacter sp. KBS0702 TaxID=2578107 RepID=UPI00110DBF0F|nr:hypothetical protein [Arthrobacter sp. KBS0702]QDW30050.1 hypothetical protein FFF93_009950 [Arthrobacter sp. KBS0702]
MNSDEIWLLQLWSGVIGSFVSAVLGGLVALLVVRLTNGQQKRHAAEARQIAAIADLLAATAAMIKKYREGAAVIQDLLLAAEAASLRWQMEDENKILPGEIGKWPYHMGTLALATFTNREVEADRSRYFDLMSAAWTELSFCAMAWPKATPAQRDAHVSLLQGARLEQESAMSDVENATAFSQH